MNIIKTDSAESAIQRLTNILNAAIYLHKHIVWFVSGGSAIEIAVEVQKRLKSTEGLLVLQADERFGPVDHPDSNWRKLKQAGFDPNKGTSYPVLHGKDLRHTTEEYNTLLGITLAKSNFTVALLGIGTDGHTAGIMPHSQAVVSPDYVYGYEWADFMRITLTPQVFPRIHTAIVYAMGAGKKTALEKLQRDDVSVGAEPAQALKHIENVWVYNDQVGETEHSDDDTGEQT